MFHSIRKGFKAQQKRGAKENKTICRIGQRSYPFFLNLRSHRSLPLNTREDSDNGNEVGEKGWRED